MVLGFLSFFGFSFDAIGVFFTVGVSFFSFAIIGNTCETRQRIKLEDCFVCAYLFAFSALAVVYMH